MKACESLAFLVSFVSLAFLVSLASLASLAFFYALAFLSSFEAAFLSNKSFRSTISAAFAYPPLANAIKSSFALYPEKGWTFPSTIIFRVGYPLTPISTHKGLFALSSQLTAPIYTPDSVNSVGNSSQTGISFLQCPHPF